MPEIDVCFSPNVYPLFHKDEAVVVVIDILRATSAITTAFFNGVEKMIPVATVEEAKEYQRKGYLAAAERNGEMVEGFDLGNSPFGYMNNKVKGKTIAITTTNGTQAIQAAKHSNHVIIGSFLNHKAIVEYLSGQKRPVVMLCAGWKSKFNLEDTLFAGAVVDALLQQHNYTTTCDSALASRHLYHLAKEDMYEFLSASSHRNRLHRLNLERDVKYCLTPNQCPVIPILKNGELVRM